MAALEFLAGALILAAVLYDVFVSIEVPRVPSRNFRLTPSLFRTLWSLWRLAGLRIRTSRRREDFLRTFAPIALLATRFLWLLAMLIAYGMIIHGLRDQFQPPASHWSDALFLSGSCLLTFGPSGFTVVGGAARFVLLLAGVSGLAVLTMLISVMFTVYGQLHRREALVLTLSARAGTPPSGVTLLETYAALDMLDELPALFAAWEAWTAEMVENHAAYPVLPYFRSASANQSWISALACVLDAATLLLAVVDASGEAGRFSGRRSRSAAQLMVPLGCRVLADLNHTFGLEQHEKRKGMSDAEPAHAAGVRQDEFLQAYQRLGAAGYALCDPEEAWAAFSGRRGEYATAAHALLRHFALPHFRWIEEPSTRE
jgi:hypothetical protein